MKIALTFTDFKTFVPSSRNLAYATDAAGGVEVVIDPAKPTLTYRPTTDDGAAPIAEAVFIGDYPTAVKLIAVNE